MSLKIPTQIDKHGKPKKQLEESLFKRKNKYKNKILEIPQLISSLIGNGILGITYVASKVKAAKYTPLLKLIDFIVVSRLTAESIALFWTGPN